MTIYGNKAASLNLTEIRHPHHTLMEGDWRKFRLAFEGGSFFKEEFLQKFTTRESDTDFNLRKCISYVPAHAKAAVMEIRNSIYQRMVDITRVGGAASYQRAIDGYQKGVDGKGNTMNGFIGRETLQELLVLGRVGVFVDKTQVSGGIFTLAEARNIQPYLYIYQAEDILSWAYNINNELEAVLLRDHNFTYDETTGLITGHHERYRFLQLVEGRVKVEFHGPDPSTAPDKKPEIIRLEDPVYLDLDEIPFVIGRISSSLMIDIADYQISLLNLGSSDINYALKSNFPFYTEQFSPAQELPHLKRAQPADDGSNSLATTSDGNRIDVGVTRGRKYPKGLERPQFINPSAEPLRASMDLQQKLKEEIRQIVNLNLSNLSSSAESKKIDNLGLEAGLAAIGLELENMERNIGRIWSKYEGERGEVTVKYPDSYEIRTDDDRRREAGELREILPTVPSKTFQKQTAKDMVRTLQGHKVSAEDLQKMFDEIDRSVVVVSDPDVVKQDHEAGFVGTKTASRIRGYPEGEAEQAAKDHAERAMRIAAAQSSVSVERAAARGVPDMDTDPNESGQQERREANDTTLQTTTEDRTRGEGQ